MTSDEVPLFFDKNLETLKIVIGCAEKAAKIRKAEEKARTNLLTKQKFSFDSNGKLSNCESRDASKCEIFIVEEILPVVPPKWRETVCIRRSCRSAEKF